MANVYKGTLGLIGKTPLVELVNIEKRARDWRQRFLRNWSILIPPEA